MGKKTKLFLTYFLGAVTTFAILVLVTKLWECDLRIPFVYSSDGLTVSMVIKGMVEKGDWYFKYQSIGMPSGLRMYDYPMSDNLYLFILKIISLFISNPSVVLNVYYILCFELITIFSMFALRQWKLSYKIALPISILYSFLPFHLLRSEIHLFLTSYFMVPCCFILIIWMSENKLFIKEIDGKYCFNILDKYSIMSILISIIIACSGIYYAFFSCFFLFVTGLMISINKKNYKYIFISLSIILVIFIGVLMNFLPSIMYQIVNGKNIEVAQRNWVESEIYGLKISQLLLPVDGHRIGILNTIKGKYNMMAPLVNENTTATLGIIGDIGFLALIGLLFANNQTNKTKRNLELQNLKLLSYLNISGVLLGTTGGFCVIFAIVISPSIRAYNRISVYLAFIALTALGIILKIISDKFVNSKLTNLMFTLALVAVTAIGIFDQTTLGMIPDYHNIKIQFENDDKFVKKIEKVMPENSMIYQLPYFPYPENGPINRIQDYEPIKAYLHSTKLRWSYPSMKGRATDLWERKLSKETINQFLIDITKANFKGLYIDRFGYNDNGINIQSECEKLLKQKPILSGDNRYLFFDLRKFKK